MGEGERESRGDEVGSKLYFILARFQLFQNSRFARTRRDQLPHFILYCFSFSIFQVIFLHPPVLGIARVAGYRKRRDSYTYATTRFSFITCPCGVPLPRRRFGLLLKRSKSVISEIRNIYFCRDDELTSQYQDDPVCQPLPRGNIA